MNVADDSSGKSGLTGNEDRVDQLIADLQTQSRPKLVQVIQELAKIGDIRAAIPLGIKYEYRKGRVRRHAKAALRAIRDRVLKKGRIEILQRSSKQLDPVEELLMKMYDGWGYIRTDILRSLGYTPDDRVNIHLINALFLGEEESRIAAAAALEKKGGIEIVSALIAALEDPSVRVRDSVQQALANIGSSSVKPLIKALKSGNPVVRRIAIEILGDIKDNRAIKPLIRLLKDKYPFIYEEAEKALSKFGKEAVDPMIDALSSPHHQVRSIAVNLLGRLKDERALEPLIERLKDDHDEVCLLAVEALGKLKHSSVVEPLISVLTDTRDEFRLEAATTLKNISSPNAFEPLVRALDDENPEVQAQAALALGKIGDVNAVEPLLAKVTERQDGVWEYAVLALGDLGDARAMGPLMYLAGSKYNIPEAREILEGISSKLQLVDHGFLCEKCYCRAIIHMPDMKLLTDDYKVYFSFRDYLHMRYYACHKCHTDLYLLTEISKVVLMLDHHFEETPVREGFTITVNWFKIKELIDYDEIRIVDADDFEVEQFILKLKNDMVEHRRKRMPNIPVYLSPALQLSPSKKNLLEDNFKVRKMDEVVSSE
jgi:HEAT repeat protein